MKSEVVAPLCAICGLAGSVTIDPPRRTLARESSDPGFSVIAVLPDVMLCDEHADEISHRKIVLGWCDDEKCRAFGEARHESACGALYKELKR